MIRTQSPRFILSISRNNSPSPNIWEGCSTTRRWQETGGPSSTRMVESCSWGISIRHLEIQKWENPIPILMNNRDLTLRVRKTRMERRRRNGRYLLSRNERGRWRRRSTLYSLHNRVRCHPSRRSPRMIGIGSVINSMEIKKLLPRLNGGNNIKMRFLIERSRNGTGRRSIPINMSAISSNLGILRRILPISRGWGTWPRSKIWTSSDKLSSSRRFSDIRHRMIISKWLWKGAITWIGISINGWKIASQRS